jgi:hypothetical protein
MKRAILVGVACLFATASQSKGASILVGQCIEGATCFNSGAPWSDSLTLANLTSLGLGSTVPLIAAQTSMTIIRLGVTTLTFTTSGSPVTETLPEFSGGAHGDPCNLCEIDTVGTFAIPSNALSAIISGNFGNSANPTSAGVNVCLGSGAGPCSAATVPEPGTLKSLGATLVALAGLHWLRRRMRTIPTSPV